MGNIPTAFSLPVSRYQKVRLKILCPVLHGISRLIIYIVFNKNNVGIYKCQCPSYLVLRVNLSICEQDIIHISFVQLCR